jgi:hypothetical protein
MLTISKDVNNVGNVGNMNNVKNINNVDKPKKITNKKTNNLDNIANLSKVSPKQKKLYDQRPMANWVRPRPSSYRGQAVRSTISKTWSPPPFKGRSCVSGFAVPATPPKGRIAGEPRGHRLSTVKN